MPYAVKTRAQLGISAPEVIVEAHATNGTKAFTLVGLPQTAVREARDRVASAIKNSRLAFPNGRLVVNLSPADLAKQGGRYDLAIALAILAATEQIDTSRLDDYEFIGELSLYGEVRPVRGCFSAGSALADTEKGLVLPYANAPELAWLKSTRLFPIEHLLDAVALLKDPAPVPHAQKIPQVTPAATSVSRKRLADVRGQLRAKRALSIAATGAHHMLMVGPPGTGKTMLAERLAGLLPEARQAEAIEIANIHSIAGRPCPPFGQRPFRDPHHTASSPALVGGGNPTVPGEVSLAHHGVLFLDELPEFQRGTLEALREPLESGEIVVARLGASDRYPAAFQLVAAMNPCPAGLTCDERRCRCTPGQVLKYRSRVSGPLLDRIDLHVEVGPVPESDLFNQAAVDDEAELRARISNARERQIARAGKSNRDLGPQQIDQYCKLSADQVTLLKQAVKKYALSARAVHRILKVARSVADLDDQAAIAAEHLAEALSFRAAEPFGE